jgi:predicted acetyltransferase
VLRLSAPDPALHASYLGALEEMVAEGTAHYLDLVLPPEPGFPGVAFTATALRDPAVFEQFCAYTVALGHEGTPRPADWCTSTLLWMVDGSTVVGRISLRHELTPWLLEVGGHIGYAVRPTARRRGHGTAALRLMREVAAGRGISPALVTCDVDNLGSRGVIEANGGILEDVRGSKRRYWVPCP